MGGRDIIEQVDSKLNKMSRHNVTSRRKKRNANVGLQFVILKDKNVKVESNWYYYAGFKK